MTHVTPQHAKFSITVDGERIESEGVGVLIVNFSKIQFDLSVVHNNLPRDGMFDIVILNTKDAFGLIPALVACILDRSGVPRPHGCARDLQGREITVESDLPAHAIRRRGHQP